MQAVGPIALAVAVIVGYILVTGLQAVHEAPPETTGWIHVVGNGDSYMALIYGSLAGLLFAAGLAWLGGTLSLPSIGHAAVLGTRLMLPALIILWLAWSLSRVCDSEYLQTGDYLAGLLTQRIPPFLLPTLVFLIASLVAFATGTSWGTMGILMPLVVPLTHQVLSSSGAEAGADEPLFLATVGSVLAGAIFGDHCSPISDTTILSSQASGCHHLAHVATQLPYALLVAVVSVLLGTLPIGLGVNAWVLLPLGPLSLALCLWLLGRRS
jgi:Na+/H+ antiporter NhaC